MAPFNAALHEIFPQGTPEDVPMEKTYRVSMEVKIHADETLDKVKTWLQRGFYLNRSQSTPYLVCYDEVEKGFLASKIDPSSLKLVSMDEFDEITCPER